MNKSFLVLSITGLIALSAFTLSSVTNWKVAEDFEIRFTSKDPSGVFTEFDGDINFSPDDLANARFDLTIPVASINTGNGRQNRHAVSKKWFDAETYPEIRFTSSAFSKTDAGYEVTGTMKIHGVEQEMTIPFTFDGSVFAASFSVDRTVYGIGKPGGKVPNELAIDVRVPVTQG